MQNTLDSKHFLTIAKATEILAPRDFRKSDTIRTSKIRTSGLIKYQVKTGKIILIDNKLDSKELFGLLKNHKSFKGKIDDLESSYNHKPSGGVKLSGSAEINFDKAIPSNFEDAILEIKILRKKNKTLKQNVNELEAKNKILETEAEKAKKKSNTNSENAKRPRRV